MAKQQSLLDRIADRRPLLELLISDLGRFQRIFRRQWLTAFRVLMVAGWKRPRTRR